MKRRTSYPTTATGYVNRNRQKVHGTRGVSGTDHLQKAYKWNVWRVATITARTVRTSFSVNAHAAKAAR